MRNRAKPETAPAPTSTAPRAPPEPEPKKPTKYDELVGILADGLLEVLMAEGPTRTSPR